MSELGELKRLLEETNSDVERALLHAGVSYRSSRETRAKTLTALGLAGSTAIAAGTAGAASATAALSPLTKLTGMKILLALSAVGAVTAVPLGYRAMHHRSPAPVVSAESERHAAAEASVSPAGIDLNGAGPAPARADERSPEVTGGRSRAGARPPSSSVSLTQELAALDAARSMLARGNSQGALFLLDGYDRTCPHGKLEIEADLLRIDALAKNGQSRDARHRAEAFLRRHPGSLLTSRARTYLDD